MISIGCNSQQQKVTTRGPEQNIMYIMYTLSETNSFSPEIGHLKRKCHTEPTIDVQG